MFVDRCSTFAGEDALSRAELDIQLSMGFRDKATLLASDVFGHRDCRAKGRAFGELVMSQALGLRLAVCGLRFAACGNAMWGSIPVRLFGLNIQRNKCDARQSSGPSAVSPRGAKEPTFATEDHVVVDRR